MSNTQSSSFASNMVSIYLWILFGIVILKCFIFDTMKNAYKNSKFILIFVSALFFIYLFASNMQLTKNDLICGNANFNVAFTATIFPYIFIYGLGIGLIHIFKGWKRSFSNTFGLTVCRMMGYNFQNYFDDKSSENTSLDNSSPSKTGDDDIKKIYTTIYNNPDVFINELVLDETGDIKNIPISIFEKIGDSDKQNKFKTEISQYIIIKDTIGTYIWVALLSVLTILTSQNTLLNENCSKKVTDQTEFNNYVASQLKN